MTTTQDMTREERDAAMVARYAAGETLDAIGQSFGITRERVRQIIAKVGGASAEESRRKRLAAREETYKPYGFNFSKRMASSLVRWPLEASSPELKRCSSCERSTPRLIQT